MGLSRLDAGSGCLNLVMRQSRTENRGNSAVRATSSCSCWVAATAKTAQHNGAKKAQLETSQYKLGLRHVEFCH